MVKTINPFCCCWWCRSAGRGSRPLGRDVADGTRNDADKDAETMMNMANAIAAGVKVGAAEIPQMSEAILQVGAVSKEAGLNINELNATLQAMAVGGKYGAEAGTVLRNIPHEDARHGRGGSRGVVEAWPHGHKSSSTLQGQGIGAHSRPEKSFDSNSNAAERNASIMKIFDKYNGAALMGFLRKCRYVEDVSDRDRPRGSARGRGNGRRYRTSGDPHGHGRYEAQEVRLGDRRAVHQTR
ncbi:MAG: phage tail tape measure protein [Ignavibacteria bacterium]|nr:phage tail tape measure protein [Ignavibacteria bacterium]